MPYYITEACVDVMDRSCVRECPVDCIYEGARSMYINPDECIDCGACEYVCPQDAIVFDVDMSPEQEPVIDRTKQWVTTHHATGKARVRGPVGIDHHDIAVLPPQAD